MHQDFMLTQTPSGRSKDPLLELAIVRVAFACTDDSLEQRKALFSHMTDLHNQTDPNTFHGSIRELMIELAHPAFQTRAPECSQIHRQGPIALVAARLPCALTQHLVPPSLHQVGNSPYTAAQRLCTTPDLRDREPAHLKSREYGPSAPEKRATEHRPQQMQKCKIRPDGHRLYNVFNGFTMCSRACIVRLEAVDIVPPHSIFARSL